MNGNITTVKSNGCFNCTERHIGCHGTCEKYKQWKEEYLEQKKVIKTNEIKHTSYFYHK